MMSEDKKVKEKSRGCNCESCKCIEPALQEALEGALQEALDGLMPLLELAHGNDEYKLFGLMAENIAAMLENIIRIDNDIAGVAAMVGAAESLKAITTMIQKKAEASMVQQSMFSNMLGGVQIIRGSSGDPEDDGHRH